MLLEHVRAQSGLRLGSSFPPMPSVVANEAGEMIDVVRQLFIGWTTDAEKGQRAREAGAAGTGDHGPRADGGRGEELAPVGEVATAHPL